MEYNKEESKEFVIEKWVLEDIENVLELAYRYQHTETCYKRDLKGSLSRVRKILDGVEIDGMERASILYHRKSS